MFAFRRYIFCDGSNQIVLLMQACHLSETSNLHIFLLLPYYIFKANLQNKLQCNAYLNNKEQKRKENNESIFR